MAALTAAASRSTRNLDGKKFTEYTVGTGATLYAGALVSVDTATGRAVAASKLAARTFLGMAEETKTGVTAATVRCRVSWGYEALFNACALTTAYIGQCAAVSTDNDITTVSDGGTTSAQVRVGEVIELESGDAWVFLRSYPRTDIDG